MSTKNEILKEFLETIDVLIDGPFILEMKDLTLKYRGSSNQRIIDVKKSLKHMRIFKKDLRKEQAIINDRRNDFVFI